MAGRSERVPCAELWYKAVVNAQGKVVLCCNDYLAVATLGSVKRQSIWEIWNGAAIRDLRKRHTQGRYEDMKLCFRCPEWSSAQDMEAYLPEARTIANRP